MLTILANHIIVSESVETAMKKVDRGNYSSHNPYYDSPQTIGEVTSSIYHCILHAAMRYMPIYSKPCYLENYIFLHTVCTVGNVFRLMIYWYFSHTLLYVVLFILGYQATISAPHMVSVHMSCGACMAVLCRAVYNILHITACPCTGDIERSLV